METIASLNDMPSVEGIETPPLTFRQLVWLRFKRHKMAVFGIVVLILLILYSTLGALFFTEAEANLTDIAIKFSAPSAEHPFGTDPIGRDILARTIFGGQISLMIGFIAVLVAVIVGVLIGAIAGYYGGAIDNILMRFTEAMFNVPQLPLLLVLGKMLI